MRSAVVKRVGFQRASAASERQQTTEFLWRYFGTSWPRTGRIGPFSVSADRLFIRFVILTAPNRPGAFGYFFFIPFAGAV